MCTGRLDLAHVLRAFVKGADGVSIAGCHINECNYTTHGNFHALSMTYLGKRLMEHIGLDPERLRIDLVSSGEGNRFAEIMNDFGTTVRELGPLGSSEGVDESELESRLQELLNLVPYMKVVLLDKLTTRFQSQAEYQDLFTREEIDELLSGVVSYYIDPDKCRACMICRNRCPVQAIEGDRSRIHVIAQDECIKCGTCFEVCPPRFDAVVKYVGEPAPPPIPEKMRAMVKKSREGLEEVA